MRSDAHAIDVVFSVDIIILWCTRSFLYALYSRMFSSIMMRTQDWVIWRHFYQPMLAAQSTTTTNNKQQKTKNKQTTLSIPSLRFSNPFHIYSIRQVQSHSLPEGGTGTQREHGRVTEKALYCGQAHVLYISFCFIGLILIGFYELLPILRLI